MHNGVVANFHAIRRDFLDLLDRDTFEHMQGTTDSEHMAALYMTCLTRSKGTGTAAWEQEYPASMMKGALEAAFRLIIQLQTKQAGAHPESKLEASSLNVCVTDGTQLVAVRFRNHVDEQPPSLYYSTTAGVTLNRKYPDNHNGTPNNNAVKRPHEHGDHVIVGSEPTTYKPEEWHTIPKNSAVLVHTTGRLTIEKMDATEELMVMERSEIHG